MKKIFLGIVFTFFIPVLSHAAILNLKIISSNNGVLGNDYSTAPSISADGKFIVFESDATNLVEDDINNVTDIFVYDVEDDKIERVSLSSEGDEANNDSTSASISADGRYISFASEASNLVPGDTNEKADIFVYDINTGEIEIISVNSDEEEANNETYVNVISADGRYVVFSSSATNLVSGDTNSIDDVFVRDRVLGTTERVSVSSDEVEGVGGLSSDSVSISADGRYVVFSSSATNLVSGDTNSIDDVFVRDRVLGTTERVSVSSDEVETDSISYTSSFGQNVISADGRYVVFSSDATNLVSGDTNEFQDVFLRDRVLGTTERVSINSDQEEVDGSSYEPSISPDGRYVAFASNATNLVEDDTNERDDIFFRDTINDFTERVNVSIEGVETDDNSGMGGTFATGGRYAVYSSEATNLEDDDNNETSDIFFAEIQDMDGVSSLVEDDAPNNGDVDENGYDDAIEDNVSSFVNSVSGNYTSVVTTGDCFYNSNLDSNPESELGTQDSEYDYPLGIISFEVNCRDAGEAATVSVYCFCNQTPLDGLVARKYDPDTGEYTTIESAVIEEVTIDGDRALKMTYDVVDGGALDEDGLENGTIIDPVGFGKPAAQNTNRGGSRSSGYIPKEKLVVAPTNNQSEESCSKFSLITSMKKGSKFGEVSLLQEFLSGKGFAVGIVDGLFGPKTDMAVKAFQSANSLISDGIVGPMTRGVINSKCK